MTDIEAIRRKLAEVCGFVILGPRPLQYYKKTEPTDRYYDVTVCLVPDWLPDQNWNHCGMVIEAITAAVPHGDKEKIFRLMETKAQLQGLIESNRFRPAWICEVAYAAVCHD